MLSDLSSKPNIPPKKIKVLQHLLTFVLHLCLCQPFKSITQPNFHPLRAAGSQLFWPVAPLKSSVLKRAEIEHNIIIMLCYVIIMFSLISNHLKLRKLFILPFLLQLRTYKPRTSSFILNFKPDQTLVEQAVNTTLTYYPLTCYGKKFLKQLVVPAACRWRQG